MTDHLPPLSGITVLDLGQIYQGPYAGFLMAKAGADVIKVEPPNGEALRLRSAVGGGAILPFCLLNANKKCVTLNLKAERGRELLFEMVKRADVLIENFAPGVMDRLGAGWSKLKTVNPRLVYASGTGYGLSGPDMNNLAMDLTVQAAAGVMATTGFPNGPPVKAGPAVADFLSGTHLYAAAMTGLVARQRTKEGMMTEVAMVETLYPTLASNLGLMYESKAANVARTGNRHGGMAQSPYNVYPAKDGFVAVICVTESHWQALCKAMGREELVSDPRFGTMALRVANMDATDAAVGQWTATKTRAEIVAAGQTLRFPASAVREIPELVNDKHMHERGMLEWVDHPELGRVVLPNSPLRFHDTDTVATLPSAPLGADNARIYEQWLGLPKGETARLKDQGII